MKTMKMSEGGRVVVPAAIRKALSLHDGDVVFWELVDGEARLTSKLSRLRRSQELVLKRCPRLSQSPDESLSEASVVSELIADRRREASLD